MPVGWLPRSPRHRPSSGRVPDQAPFAIRTIGFAHPPPRLSVMSSHAVETRELVKRFGATTAVDGVDLVVPHGAVYGLLGPNGAGKTTIVRMLTTLLRPDAGVALVDGIDVCRDPDGVRRRIGLTGQYAAVEERLTGRENMQYVGRLFHMPKAERLAARRGVARAVRPGRRRRPGRQDLLGWHAAAARHRDEPDRPAVGAVPRRADDRARPA